MKKSLLVWIIASGITCHSFSQNVGIGTNSPQTKLQVVGAISSTPTTLPAAATVTIPANTSVFLLSASAGAQANTLSIGSAQEGQYLTIYNADDDPATFNGQTIAATGGVASFNFISGGWRMTSNTKAGGDLSGTYPNPTVAKIQGRDVSTTAPANGDVLKYNNVTGKYEPSPDLNSGGTVGSVTASSPLSSTGGSSPNISLTGTVPVSNGGTGLTAIGAGQVLVGTSSGTFLNTTLTGTANQVNVNSASGSVTLSTPQDIGTSSSPTFNKLTATGANINSIDATGSVKIGTTSATAGTAGAGAVQYTGGNLQFSDGSSWKTVSTSTGTVSSIATSNGITGGTITTTGTIGLTGNALAMHNLSTGMVALTGSGTAAARTITGTTRQIDVTNGNGVSGNPTVAISPTYTAITKAGHNITGGGTVTYSTGYNLSWSNRFIVISTGNGSHFSTNGYFDITQPANGTVIPGYGGAASQTVAGGVINIPTWQALYYILPTGSGNGSLAANFLLASYTSAMVVPENWVLIAVRNGDDNTLRLGNGVTLIPGQTYSASTGSVTGNGTANYLPKFTSATAIGNSVVYESGNNIGIGTTTTTEKMNVNGNQYFTGTRAEIYANDRNHMIVLRGDQAGNAGNQNSYYQFGGTLAAGLGHRFFTGGAVASQTEKMRIADDGTYIAGPVGIGTAAPAANTRLHVRGGRTYLNQLNTDASSGYATADLVLGDDVSTRNGYGGTNGSHLFLQSSDKSTISALDQGNDVGQIAYQNLKWTIGEDIGWGAQLIRFPRYTNGVLTVDGSGNLNARSIAVSGNGIGVTNGNGSAGNPTLNLNYGNTMASAAGAGGWPVGNFGQFENHGAYTDFNVTPNYWGWNYVQGSTNAPTTQSSQWYRENISLGANYAGRGAGGYSLELAYPRDYQNNTGVWMRTVENGTINGWKRITGGDFVYVEDRTLRTYANNAGGGSGSVSVNTTPALAVVTGDVIHISTTFQFAFTGGSGNDDWWPIVNISGCATSSKVLISDVENYDNDRNEFEPASFDWIYVSPCTGNLQFNLSINAESDADDGYKVQDVVVTATRH